MPINRTCFLICPIGDEGSETRKNSDDLLELVIMPALERFNFNVVRADKIPSPSTITTDIIQHVQNADLCIIDLTGSNPNVFYECGRRHETGKPFIQLIRKGEKLPFDVSSIRTIEYDISSPRTTRESVLTIQRFVEELDNAGFQPVSSGVSLSSVADTLERIERRINSMSFQESLSSIIDVDPAERIKLKLRPGEYFLDAFNRGDADGAREALIRMHDTNMDPNDILIASCRLAELGDTEAFKILNEVLSSSATKITMDTWLGFITFIRRSYIDRKQAKECHNQINPALQIFLSDDETTNVEKGILLNEISILQSAFGDYENSLTNAKKVIELDNSNMIYYYNLAMVYRDLKMPDKSLEQVDIYAKGEDVASLPSYIITYAVETYLQAERQDDAKRVFNILKSVDPTEARYALNTVEGLQAIL